MFSLKTAAFVTDKKNLADTLDYTVTGASIIYLLVDIVIYWILVLFMETRVVQHNYGYAKDWLLGKIRNRNRKQTVINIDADEDIAEEELKVEQMNKDQLPIRVCKIKKNYGKTVAVEKVSFGLEYGECFALLGVSGAGKTTTFKCLTGEEVPSEGEVTINGFDITRAKGFNQARKLIGYCP